MEKRLAVMGLALALFGAGAFAVGFIGAPTAGLDKGQWTAGFNYSYSAQDYDNSTLQWSYAEYDGDGEPVSSETDSFTQKFKDLHMHRYYGTLGYGLEDWWEINVSVGLADVKMKRSFWEGDDWFGINLDNDLAWGWGTKITFARQDKIDWGAALQMNWLDTQMSEGWAGEDMETGVWEEKVNINVETWDLLIAVGPTIDMGGWKLYGGPFYYYLDGDYTENWSGTWDDGEDSGSWTEKAKGDLEAESHFGGYIGAQFDIARGWTTNVEFSLTGDGWGAGAAIAVKF